MRFFKPVLLSFTLAFALCLSAGPAVAAGDVKISDAYAFAVPQGAKNAAAFMQITYTADGAVVPDRIIRAESTIAAETQIHTMQIEDDVMSMRQVDSFPLPPTGSFMLTPHGVHIMFMDLNRTLTVGDSFPLTLVFEKAGAVETSVTVRAAGDIPAAPDHHHDHDDGHHHDHHH